MRIRCLSPVGSVLGFPWRSAKRHPSIDTLLPPRPSSTAADGVFL